eukprot:jgi/Mesvir1/23833/Mv10639-RA.1
MLSSRSWQLISVPAVPVSHAPRKTRTPCCSATEEDEKPSEKKLAALRRPPAELKLPPPPTDAVNFVAWGGEVSASRRLVFSSIVGAGVCLGGNLLGITSALLGLIPDSARGGRFDVIFPVKGFQRCLNTARLFEFIYPQSWLADQMTMPLDPPSLRSLPYTQRRAAVAYPEAAYGPPGSSGQENLSVIVTPAPPGMTLATLGTPIQVAQRLLSTSIAPEGSGKQFELLQAAKETSRGREFYTMEYRITTSSWQRHSTSKYTIANGLLYSMTIMCSERDWLSREATFKTIQHSFMLLGR